MYALAWMSNRENHKELDIKGGILADDMGLGKTLTVLSLIMTNFHDKKPLARPSPGFERILSIEVRKYLPATWMSTMTWSEKKDQEAVGSKCKSTDNMNFLDLFESMDKENDSGNKRATKRKKDMYQKVKSSKRKMTTAETIDAIDDDLLSEAESDEFDSMLEEKGLSQKLGIDADPELLLKPSENTHHNDGLSDDEEYQNMTAAERNKAMLPSSMQVDGSADLISSDDEVPLSHKKKRSQLESSDDELEANESNDELPDIDFKEDEVKEKTPKPSLEKKKSQRDVPHLTEEQMKNLIVPPNMPAICGSRRRATLIVAPVSLITHWIQQIQEHVDKR